MTTQDTPVDEAAELDYDHEAEQAWLDEPDELPRRPRRKLLSPVPATLLAVLLLAVAFWAGVEVQKSHGSSSGSSGFPAGLAALRSGGAGGSGAKGSSGRGASSFPGGGASPFGGGGLGGGGLTTGEVSYVSGNTLYVVSGENTVKVKVPEGTKVSKTVSTSVDGVHPGETVLIRGSKSKDGSVTASSVTASPASTTGTTGTGGSSGSSGGGAATPQLFGSG